MNQKGQTLIEVVIGVVLLAVVFTGLFQALAVGIWGTFLDNQLTTAQQIAQSEIDYIKSQAYDAEAPYQYYLIDLDGNLIVASTGVEYCVLHCESPASFNVSYLVSEVPDVDRTVFQQITMTVSYPGGKPQQVVAYKANVEYGELVQCTDSHEDGFDIPKLNGGQGYYYVVTSVNEGPISAFWAIDKVQAIELYIYAGTPSDLGDLIAFKDGDMVTSTSPYTVPPGDYTVYFYLVTGNNIGTDSATVSYACQ